MTKHWKLFDNILDQPAIYLGLKSVTRLKAYMDGYIAGLEQVNPSAENFNMGFNEWVAERFQIKTANNWASIILFMNSGDESSAFDMTKELWEEYKVESTSLR